MAAFVLGAPGSGKSTVRAALAEALADYVVIDWDDFMEPASALLGADVRTSPQAWVGYRGLVRTAVDLIGHDRVVILGVCTPDELDGWPIDHWVLLDCSDDERAKRLASRPRDVPSAIQDAHAYRNLGLATIDSTDMAPEAVATALAAETQRRP